MILINKDISKFKIITFIIFVACNSQEEEVSKYYGSNSLTLNSDSVVFKTRLTKMYEKNDSFILRFDQYSSDNIITSSLTFSGFTLSPNIKQFLNVEYYNSNIFPNSHYSTYLDDGHITGNYYSLDTLNFKSDNFIEISQFEPTVKGYISGKYIIDGLKKDNSKPDTIFLIKSEFETKILPR